MIGLDKSQVIWSRDEMLYIVIIMSLSESTLVSIEELKVHNNNNWKTKCVFLKYANLTSCSNAVFAYV